MNWNEIQNVLSNIVFGILLFEMITYWINLSLFSRSEASEEFIPNEAKRRVNVVNSYSTLLAKIGRVSTIFANGLLFFILCSRWIVAGYFPLSNLYESLLFLTWILLTIYLYIEIKTKSKLIGSVLIPVALLISGFANLTLSPEMQKASPLVPALQSNWLMMHVSMMLLSYGTLIIGSLLCILFLVISRSKEINLKIIDDSSLPLYNIMLDYYDRSLLASERRDLSLSLRRDLSGKLLSSDSLVNLASQRGSNEISELGKLKLLQSLDNWSYRIIGLGFPFLTMGIISGGVWANEAWGSYWSWDPKETWALITWLVFATYLHARITKGWEGKKTALLGSLGFFVIWICYLGVNFLGKGLHSYGWLS